jgi:metal-responsive CopG/Arc/MetJ family transcriptional regulator
MEVYKVAKVKISVVMDEEIIEKVDKVLPKRKRSAFVSRAVEKELKHLQQEQLRIAYQEAYQESKEVWDELEGVISDGID